jgi:hypothetical protein
MIENDEQLNQSVEQLGRLYRGLASVYREEFPRNASLFALMAEGPLEHIRRLEREIAEYTGVSAAEESEAELWLRIHGRDIEAHAAPTSVLTAFLDALRKGVQSVAEFVETGRLTTRPTASLKQACDLRVVALQAGSLRIGVRLPVPEQASLSVERGVGDKALAEFLSVASWASSESGVEELEHRIVDPQRRRVFLNALRGLLPRSRGAVDYVEISGARLKAAVPVRLTRQTQQRVDAAIDRAVAEKVETHEGDLREIDLDKLSFTLRNIGDVQEVPCSFAEDVLEIAKEALDRRVRVTGTRRTPEGRRASVLQITRLEILDDAEGGEV